MLVLWVGFAGPPEIKRSRIFGADAYKTQNKWNNRPRTMEKHVICIYHQRVMWRPWHLYYKAYTRRCFTLGGFRGGSNRRWETAASRIIFSAIFFCLLFYSFLLFSLWRCSCASKRCPLSLSLPKQSFRDSLLSIREIDLSSKVDLSSTRLYTYIAPIGISCAPSVFTGNIHECETIVLPGKQMRGHLINTMSIFYFQCC